MDGGVPPRKRLSIYDSAPVQTAVAPAEPSSIELGLRGSRHAVSSYFSGTRETIQSYTNSYLAFESSALDSIKPFTSPSEPLLPNALYVTLATCAGIVATSSSQRFGRRVGAPLGLGAAAVAWWYPQTSSKVLRAGLTATGADIVWDDVSQTVGGSLESARNTINNTYKEASDAVVSGVNSVTGATRK
ncbi:UNVERIFIED_CONTAM: hypothetical protein HDU68_000879 [Siphonaria sp. JEL0065]|nr:hypothetical protein HDU68_000879 [Siphonaria sp. JEL0065]